MNGRGLNKDISRDHPLVKAIRVHHEDLLGAPVPLKALPPGAVNSDGLPMIGGVGDQGAIGSCVPFTIWRDLLGLAVAAQTGQPVSYSWLGAYTQTLKMQAKLDGKPLGEKVTDDGSEPSTAILTLSTCGPNLEAEWPSDPATFGQTQGLVQAGQATPRVPVSLTAYSILNATGDALLSATAQGLLPYADGKRGRGVVIEIASSYPAFDDATGAAVLGAPPSGLSLDHGVGLLDYRTNAAGALEWRLCNHWGTAWSPESDIPGTVWVSSDFLLAQVAMGASFYAINLEVGQ